MTAPLRAFVVWLSTQIISLFVMLEVIPREVADQYALYLADGITYLTMAGSSFYYMKHLHDQQKLPHISKEAIEEIIKRGVQHLPHPHTQHPPADATTAEQTVFHEEETIFSQDPEVPEETEDSSNIKVSQPLPETVFSTDVEEKTSTDVIGQ